MKRLQRDAVLITLIENLRAKGSWCGETHIQKAAYFLQELLEVPLGFDFILYKHGPFSFDLSDEILAMLADGLLRLQPQPPYGSSLLPAEGSKSVKENFPKTLAKYSDRVEFIAEKLGNKGVAELERLATALYVTKESDGNDLRTRIYRINQLKPHISISEARTAIETVDEIVEESKALVT